MDLSFGAINDWVTAVVLPMAIWILLSGIDDFFVDCVAAYAKLQRRSTAALPCPRDLLACPQKRVAILTPLWQESGVVAGMVQQNCASIRYENYHFFIGAYPNDQETVHVVRQLEQRYNHVHLAVCPHAGPTSKADCLNWVYQELIAFENKSGVRFDVIVTHDAEDVIHPQSLHWINFYAGEFDMVQVPVLPLPTPIPMFTHGLYCDEFAEYQERDMPARQAMGAFVPSNGVGTGFRREALEDLASVDSNRVFEPVCLTEDYENGLRVRLRGGKQMFLPVQRLGMATREYFPHSFHSAVRQRTRWVTGISLQTWDRHGWPGSFVQKYWLWRDRKVLIGSPISLCTNLMFFYGCLAYACGHPLDWHPLFSTTASISTYRTLYRIQSVRHTFGWTFAAFAPARAMYGNFVNCAATVRALWRFSKAKLSGEPLVWLKTEHAFPSQTALRKQLPPLRDVLVRNGYLDESVLDTISGTEEEMGEQLVRSGYLSETDLCDALCLQAGLPQANVDPAEVRAGVARSLPATIVRHWRILPFRVEFGTLMIACAYTPSVEMETSVRRYTNLLVRFQVVTYSNYRELADLFL